MKSKTDKNYKILCIDDSKLNRIFIKKILNAKDIFVDEAENGIKGLEMLNKSSYDLILVDIIMPEMNGFDFLKEFRKDSEQFIPIILMTAVDDLKFKIKGLNIGADDYLIKPLHEEELLARVLSLIRLKRVNSELFYRNQQIKNELDVARRIQQFIIPNDFAYIEYPVVSGLYLPIDDIGGDFFDCYKLDENRTAFVIADVTGHGIPAALTMTMAKMLFSICVDKYNTTKDLMMEINKEMMNTLLDTQYITAFYLIYDDSLKKLFYSNAGHTRALFYRSAKNQVLALDAFGFFIGISSNFEYEEKNISVNKGDRLLIYTDGISEAKNNRGEEFGELRLAYYIKSKKDFHGEEFCNGLIMTVKGFIKDAVLNDDIAFLNVEF